MGRLHIFSSCVFSIFVLATMLTGCSNLPLNKPTPTVTIYPTIRPPKSTRTPTATATETAKPSATPTISPTPTLPPPIDDFSQARLYSLGPKTGWEFSLTLLLPEPIKGDYNALVGDPPKPFICRPLTEYARPDRLYCSGRIPAAEKQVDFRIVEKDTGQIVFEGNAFVPIP